jgi:hypothetical protein
MPRTFLAAHPQEEADHPLSLTLLSSSPAVFPQQQTKQSIDRAVMKRAGCEEGTGNGKRPRSSSNDKREGEEEDVIDLTTTDSPPPPPLPRPPLRTAAGAAAASAPEVVEVVDDEEEEEEEEFGDLFLGQIVSKIVGIQYYQGIVSRVRVA